MTSQRGGFAIGLIVGLLLGLALALGVALYVTKVPVPFLNKVPQRTAEQDAAETERNKNWDPNGPLANKPAVRATAPAAAVARPPAASAAPAAASPKPATAAAPAASAAAPKSTKPGAEAFTYFVQAGAYSRPEEAEQQRAKVGLMGMSAKVTEREQAGRTMYRVRLGPFDRKEDADAAQQRLAGSGVEAALVRVER
ncbi:MAG: SPOR domain-containing protein [Pseudomonadota bacterium]